MSGCRNDWFPTSIWHFPVENHQQLNPILLQTIYTEQQQDSKGEQWSNMLGWHSVDNLHQRESFHNFTQIINKNVLEVATFLQWDLEKFSLKITTCWAIINRKFAANSVHNHPNSILSGVYYLKTPENCGGIFFCDPRPGSQMIIPPSLEFNLWTLPRITYKAYAGTMLIFPSWLLHGVEMNMSNEDRVCISFNIGIVPIRK
jgi:uncharacterized protein (TIGR02466 family)